MTSYQLSLDNLCMRCSGPLRSDRPYAYCRGCINGPLRDAATARGVRA